MINIPYDSVQLDIILDVLTNQKRRGIIHELSLRPTTVAELARLQKLSLPAIHKHIRLLETSELIIRRKVGRTNFVTLNASTLSLAQNWINQYHLAWGSTQATLENYISRMQE
jgi:DNA-binding transcriptional ArsR family regulator